MPNIFLERTFGIVVLPPDRDPDNAFGVWLMRLDSKGEPDFNHDDFFVLSRATTLEAATAYAKGLSNLLRIKVFELRKVD